MDDVNPLIVLIFGTVKVLFYVLAGVWLNYWYQTKADARLFGLARGLLGVAVGVSLLSVISRTMPSLIDWWLLVILPFRYAQWAILLVLFYDRRFQHRGKTAATAVMGTAYSYILDLPALILSFAVGAVPVC